MAGIGGTPVRAVHAFREFHRAMQTASVLRAGAAGLVCLGEFAGVVTAGLGERERAEEGLLDWGKRRFTPLGAACYF